MKGGKDPQKKEVVSQNYWVFHLLSDVNTSFCLILRGLHTNKHPPLLIMSRLCICLTIKNIYCSESIYSHH